MKPNAALICQDVSAVSALPRQPLTTPSTHACDCPIAREICCWCLPAMVRTCSSDRQSLYAPTSLTAPRQIIKSAQKPEDIMSRLIIICCAFAYPPPFPFISLSFPCSFPQ